MRQIFKWDLIKFCEIVTKVTLKLPQNSQKFVINITKCDVCLFLHKICWKMVWKFCEIWKSYGNWLPDGPNSVRFYLTVWDTACMDPGLTLTYFMARSNLVPYAYVWGKGKIVDFWETIVVYDIKVGRVSQLNEYMNLYEYQWSWSFIDLRPRSLRFNIFKLLLLRNH